jgi:hypothetical protein
MGEWRGDGMTAFKTAMNNYQSFLQTNTKTGRGVVLAIFYIFYPLFLRSSRETFVSPHYYFA